MNCRWSRSKARWVMSSPLCSTSLMPSTVAAASFSKSSKKSSDFGINFSRSVMVFPPSARSGRAHHSGFAARVHSSPRPGRRTREIPCCFALQRRGRAVGRDAGAARDAAPRAAERVVLRRPRGRPLLRDLTLHEPLQALRAVEQRRVEVVLDALHPERPRAGHAEGELAGAIHATLSRRRVLHVERELGGGAVVQAPDR